MKNVMALLAIVLVAVALGGFAVYKLEGNRASVLEQTVVTATEAGGKDNFCANNAKLDLNIRLRDNVYTDSLTYRNGTIYLVNLDTGSVTEQSYTGATTGAFTTLSDVLNCNSVKGYEVYVKFDGTINSNGKIVITPEDLTRDPVEMTIEVNRYAPFKVKGYDNIDKTKMNETTASTFDYGTSYTTSFAQNDGSTFDGTADQAMDVTFTLQQNTSSTVKGEAMIIAVNTEDESNLVDWDENTLQVWYDGVLLTEADADALQDFEWKALNSYEKVYKVENPIGMTYTSDGVVKSVERSLRIYLNTENSQAADFDPVIKIVALGDYQSTKGDTIYDNVGFKDNTAKTELATAQTITIPTG